MGCSGALFDAPAGEPAAAASPCISKPRPARRGPIARCARIDDVARRAGCYPGWRAVTRFTPLDAWVRGGRNPRTNYPGTVAMHNYDKRVYLLRIHQLTRLRGTDKLNDLWLHLGTQCGVHHRSLRRRGAQAESRAAARGKSQRRGAVHTHRRGQSQRQEHHAEPGNQGGPYA